MYSTSQVAQILKITRGTLHRWLKESLVAPRKRKIAGVSVRFWTETDLKRARAYKEKRYHQGGGRKPRKKK
jgi:DNA-binding transcriptional MerR regulator